MTKKHIFALVVISALVGYFLGDWNKSHEVADLHNRFERAFKHWDTRVGSTKLWNGVMTSYNLRTFNGGKNWYQVSYDEDWGMSIVGDAEELYPGLIAVLEGIDGLMEHTRNHGSVALTSADGPEADLLRDAGFTVVDTSSDAEE